MPPLCPFQAEEAALRAEEEAEARAAEAEEARLYAEMVAADKVPMLPLAGLPAPCLAPFLPLVSSWLAAPCPAVLTRQASRQEQAARVEVRPQPIPKRNLHPNPSLNPTRIYTLILTYPNAEPIPNPNLTPNETRRVLLCLGRSRAFLQFCVDTYNITNLPCTPPTLCSELYTS